MKKKEVVITLAALALGFACLGGCADSNLSDSVMGSVIIDKSPAEVFAFMTKDGGQGWNAALKEFKDVEGEGVGTTYNWAYEVAGQTYRGKGLVTEWIPERKEVIKSSGEIDSTWTLLWSPRENNKTKMTIMVEYSLKVPKAAKAGKEVLAQELQKEMDQLLIDLKKQLEG